MSSSLFGQPSPANCTWNPVTLSDETCSMTDNCLEREGCQTVNFTVPCDSCFCIDLDWDCPSSCRNCQGCAWVTLNDDDVMSAHYPGCNENDCHKSNCEHGGEEVLKSGLTYTLIACLSNCEQQDCEQCEEGCKLTATVRYHSASCED